MIIECINCNKKFDVNSELIPSSGRTIQCGSCNHIWFFNPSKIIPKNIKKPNKKKNIFEQKPIPKKKETNIKIEKKDNILESKNKKSYEITEYKAKTSFSLNKFLSYILVLIITFVALLIVVDTFSSFLYRVFPDLELIIFSLFETLKDIELFIKDLI
tara:strand:+ start:162 stop:635 length:474 start_codon:yes stop_codon:yes gene_type:complete